MEEKKHSKIWLVLLLLVVLGIGFGLGIVFDKNVLTKDAAVKCKEEEPKKPEEPEKPAEPEKPEEGQPQEGQQPTQPGSGEGLSKKDTIIKIYKEEAKKRGLYKENEIKDITFKVSYVNVKESESNIKYYVISGKFKCYSGDSCVYQEQLDDPDANGYYSWAMGMKFDETDGRFDYIDMGSYFLYLDPSGAELLQELQ